MTGSTLHFCNMRKKLFLTFFVFFLFFSKGRAQNDKLFILEDVLGIALEKNPQAAVFNAQLEAQKGVIVSSGAYPNPEVELEIGRGSSLGEEESISKGEFALSFSQPIEKQSLRFFRRKTAEAEFSALQFEQEAFLLALRAEVKSAFYELLLNKKQSEIAQDNFKTVKSLLQTVEKRVKSGEAPEFELVKAKVELLKAEKEVKKAENRIAISKNKLNSLTGQTLPENFDVQGAFLSSGITLDFTLLLSQSISKHPDILRLYKEKEAKKFFLELEKKSIFPQVEIKTGYSREIDKQGFAFGISIPFPLRYRRKGEIVTARAEISKTEAEIEKAKIELSTLLLSAYKNYQIAMDQVEVFDKGLLKQAEEALRIAQISYQYGESGLLDYLDAQRVYQETVLEYLQAQFEFSVSLTEIEKLSGGL